MKALSCLLLPLLSLAALSAPLPDKTVRQAANYIDGLVEKDLKKAGLKPNGLIDDGTFLRRAYLGIIGRIPSMEETSRFMENPSKDKRHELIDELVSSPGFDSHLFNWAADLLRVQTHQEQFGLGWHVWLRRSLAEDKSWSAMATEMLESTGHTSIDPAVGYYLRDRNMQLDNFSNTMEVFLGRQVGCAQCHDHPFDDWSQYEYYQMAAFGGGFQYRSQEAIDLVRTTAQSMVAQSAAKPAPKPQSFAPDQKKKKSAQAARRAAQQKQAMRDKRQRQQAFQAQFRKVSSELRPLFTDFNRNAVFDNPQALLKLPDDYQYKDAKPGEAVAPETLFGTKLEDVAPEDRRKMFAQWVASPDNPYFTKVIANRMWKRTFGFGLVEPANDWNDDSETRHPEVLAYLETSMRGSDYNLRDFLRILFHTRLFQRECLDEEPAMGVPLAFRGPVLTRMSAEQIFDSFLVLRRGEVNDSSTPTFQTKWDDYRKSVEDLLNASSRDLLVLAESAKQGEADRIKAQAKSRAAQKQLSDAKTPAAKQAAQRALARARTELRQAREEEAPIMRVNRVRVPKSNIPYRASEYPAPFSLGTMMREFGGSDRQSPSSGNTTASIPQALALLNDPQTDLFAGGRKSRLATELNKIKSPGERIDHLFLTLFATEPTLSERKRYQAMAKDPVQLRDLARAMLTSNRFLFIQ